MLALDPNETFEVRLKADPDAAFVFRFMTVRELRDYARFGDDREALARTDPMEIANTLAEHIEGRLVGWHGVHAPGGADVPYEPGRLEDICTRGELWSLYYCAQQQSRLTIDEKKDSGSPSHASTGPSAAPGDVGPAPAQTPQQ